MSLSPGQSCYGAFAARNCLSAMSAGVNRLAGTLLFALAAYVIVESVFSLLGHSEPQPSYIGTAVLIIAAIAMPLLAREKRNLAALTGSAALRADAAESAVCGYLSFIALVGLGINAVWHIRWTDPVAALAITPVIVREGWEAIRGEARGCVDEKSAEK